MTSSFLNIFLTFVNNPDTKSYNEKFINFFNDEEGIEWIICFLQHIFLFFFLVPQKSACCIGFLEIPKVLLYEATVITFIFMKYSTQKVDTFFNNGEK